jgi:type I restriction enzyme S subunit
MRQYKKYERYKDTGVEWIGKIPEEWDLSKIKYIPKYEYKSFVDGDWIESPYITDEGIRLIQTGNIGIGSYKEQGYRYISEDTFKDLNCTEVYPNDVLICRLAGPVGRACLAPSLTERMITSVDVCILKPKDNIDRRYLVYILSYDGYLQEADFLARGGTRQRISRTQLGNINILLPPTDQQKSIANFLTKNC